MEFGNIGKLGLMGSSTGKVSCREEFRASEPPFLSESEAHLFPELQRKLLSTKNFCTSVRVITSKSRQSDTQRPGEVFIMPP